MTKDCTEVEKTCDELKCDAPRVTKALIESRIVDVDYQTVVIAGQIHIKAEAEGFVADIWSSDDEPVCVATTIAMYSELEPE